MSDSLFFESKHTRRTAIVAAAIIVVALLAVVFSGRWPQVHNDGRIEYTSAIEQLAVRHTQPDPLVESQMRGRVVYQHYCQICHGADAQGNGFNAAMLDPPPRNFADEAFWQQVDDDYMSVVISQGGESVGKSVLMPSWGRTLDESQIDDVTAFLRTVPDLAKRALAAEEAQSEQDESLKTE